jgi:hypothetical protein
MAPRLDAVAIELLIEGSRKSIFEKITRDGISLRDNKLFNGNHSQFFVQNISPLEDGGVDFQVVHDNYDIHYYAFRFKNFIFCPAFLRKFLAISKYSCLVVNNIFPNFPYYYIPIYSQSDDLFSLILSNTTLKRKHYFFPLHTSNKYLTLDSDNRDIISLVSIQNLKESFSRFGSEVDEFTKKSVEDPLFESRRERRYLFVRKDIKNNLRSRYGDLFKDFDHGKTAIIHKESATAKMIKNSFNDSNDDKASDDDAEFLPLPKFDITQYSSEDYILMKLTEHIRKNYESGKTHKVEKYFSSMFSILQSSGYGKSRLVERLGATTPTFYSSLKGSNYPRVSILLLTLIEKLDSIITLGIVNARGTFIDRCFVNNISTAVYIFILRMIFLILTKKKIQNQMELLQSLNIDKELIDKSFLPMLSELKYDEVEMEVFDILFIDLEEICFLDESIIFDGKITKSLDNLEKGMPATPSSLEPQIITNILEFSVEGISTKNLEEDVINLLSEFKTDQSLPSIFIIDEAQRLLYKSLKAPKVPYRWSLRDISFERHRPSGSIISIVGAPLNIFRRIYRMFTNNWDQMMLITVSKYVEISVQLPELIGDPSRRPNLSKSAMENFSLIQTFNVNSDLFQDVKASMFDSDNEKKYHSKGEAPIKDWNEFLVSQFRKIEYFKLGRPLTYAIFKYFEEKSVIENKYDLNERFYGAKEFNFMATKLFAGTDALTFKTDDLQCLFSLFNFAFGTNHLPYYIRKEDLVEKYMMTLLKYEPYIVNQKLDEELEVEEKESLIIGGFMP